MVMSHTHTHTHTHTLTPPPVIIMNHHIIIIIIKSGEGHWQSGNGWLLAASEILVEFRVGQLETSAKSARA
jgi:hypothetical protein